MARMGQVNGSDFLDAFRSLCAIENGTITTSSATKATLTASLGGFAVTWDISGTGLTYGTVNGVTTLTGGQIAGMAFIVPGLGTQYPYGELGLSAASFGAAYLADRDGSANAALENLFRTMQWRFDGLSTGTSHLVGNSAEGESLFLTRSNTYDLGNGNDTVTAAGSGNDTIFDRDGDDSQRGNLGDDSVNAGPGNDTLVGGQGNDTLDGGLGGGADSAYGGAGNDTVGVQNSLGPVVARAWGDEGNDVLSATGIARAYGGAGVDRLTGSQQATLYGGDQNDTLTGGITQDFLYGDRGEDQLYAGAGQDRLYGGLGNDVLYAGAGNDTVEGGTGADAIFGGGGNDRLTGENGADTLTGGAGRDTMTGGIGADLFLFGALTDTGNNTPDLITDFTGGEDRIGLGGLGLTLVAGVFTGAGQVRWNSTLSRLQIDSDGDGVADRQIELAGVGAGFDPGTDLIL